MLDLKTIAGAVLASVVASVCTAWLVRGKKNHDEITRIKTQLQEREKLRRLERRAMEQRLEALESKWDVLEKYYHRLRTLTMTAFMHMGIKARDRPLDDDEGDNRR